MKLNTHTLSGIDKTSRYGWSTKDEPGMLLMIHKDVLQIHPGYQRDYIPQKVKEITSSWSWIGCGALIVGHRGGEYWVIDGQHRALAAKRRSDITHLPCVVFETIDTKQEAQGFLDANTGRKPVSAIARQKALVAAGDEIAAFVQTTCADLGIKVIKTATKPGELKSISWCVRKATENKASFVRVLSFVKDLSDQDDMPIFERVLEGVWILNAKCGNGLDDSRLAKRLREKGARLLLTAANRAAAYYTSGGGAIWAQGMLTELNKGLQKKFAIGGENGVA